MFCRSRDRDVASCAIAALEPRGWMTLSTGLYWVQAILLRSAETLITVAIGRICALHVEAYFLICQTNLGEKLIEELEERACGCCDEHRRGYSKRTDERDALRCH